jgi:hypothetical protein
MSRKIENTPISTSKTAQKSLKDISTAIWAVPYQDKQYQQSERVVPVGRRGKRFPWHGHRRAVSEQKKP